MRKLITLLVTFTVILGISATGFASPAQDAKPIYRFASSAPMITPYYTYTSSIIANLTLAGTPQIAAGLLILTAATTPRYRSPFTRKAEIDGFIWPHGRAVPQTVIPRLPAVRIP